MALTLTEELLLLALDEEGHILPLPANALEYAIAGSVLMGLQLRDKIDADGEVVRVLDKTPLKEPVLAPVLSRLLAEPEPKPISFWLRELAGDVATIKQNAFNALVAKNVLGYKDSRLVWVFRSRAYPLLNEKEERSVIVRLMVDLFGEKDPDPRDVCLICLADACNLLQQFLAERQLKALEPRLQKILGMNLVAQAVADAIAEMPSLVASNNAPSTDSGKKKRKKQVRKEKPDSWEWRAFWPGDGVQPEPIGRIAESTLSNFTRERTDDQYILTNRSRDNIKMRKGGMQIKQLLQSYNSFQAFRPKRNLDFPFKASKLADSFPELALHDQELKNLDKLLELLDKYKYEPRVLDVRKERYMLELEKDLRIEFALLILGRQQFWSACVEGHNFFKVESQAQNISPASASVCGYMDFLQQIKSD